MAELGMLKLNCAKRLLEAVEPATLKIHERYVSDCQWMGMLAVDTFTG